MTKRCWILTDGRTGSENHSRGLAEALGFDYSVYPVALRQPWKTLSPWLLKNPPRCAFTDFPDSTDWPDLLVTAGRTPAVGALYIKKASGGKTRCVQIFHPGLSPAHFDLLISPQHDGVTGDNVVTTLGALHRVTDQKLEEEGRAWQGRFASLPCPLHGLLVGGTTKHGLTLDLPAILSFIAAAKTVGGSVIATCSRRTPPEEAAQIGEAIRSAGGWLWNGEGANPYPGILALADEIAVTADSVSMLSEAAFTGKRVWILPMKGHVAKLDRFTAALDSARHARFFRGQFDSWTPVRLDERNKLTARVQDLLLSRNRLEQAP
jgi:mitochondrial fission protein ELM1